MQPLAGIVVCKSHCGYTANGVGYRPLGHWSLAAQGFARHRNRLLGGTNPSIKRSLSGRTSHLGTACNHRLPRNHASRPLAATNHLIGGTNPGIKRSLSGRTSHLSTACNHRLPWNHASRPLAGADHLIACTNPCANCLLGAACHHGHPWNHTRSLLGGIIQHVPGWTVAAWATDPPKDPAV